MSNPFDETPKDYGSVSGHGKGFNTRKGSSNEYKRDCILFTICYLKYKIMNHNNYYN